MQSTELRYVRTSIIKGAINPAGTIQLPYGEPIFRPPRGTLCFVEAGTATAPNVAATRQTYLADGSQSFFDAITEAQGVGTPAVPTAWVVGRTSRGLFIVSDALFLASTNIVTGEQVACRLQIAVYVPISDAVEPSSFDEQHEDEPKEVAVVA
jgi:hypothetical protein